MKPEGDVSAKTKVTQNSMSPQNRKSNQKKQTTDYTKHYTVIQESLNWTQDIITRTRKRHLQYYEMNRTG